jgi:uncharacterized protein
MPFEWHPAKAVSNLEKHGVSFEEATTVFDDPLQVHYPDHAHSIGEQRFICLGVSNHGRLLMLAYTERTPDIIHIITAREAGPGEQRSYEQDNSLT